MYGTITVRKPSKSSSIPFFNNVSTMSLSHFMKESIPGIKSPLKSIKSTWDKILFPKAQVRNWGDDSLVFFMVNSYGYMYITTFTQRSGPLAFNKTIARATSLKWRSRKWPFFWAAHCSHRTGKVRHIFYEFNLERDQPKEPFRQRPRRG